MRSRISAARLAITAMLVAMALAAQYLESLLPPLVPGVPVKIGLANVFTLFAFLRLGRTDALVVSVLRALLFLLVTGAVSGGIYALCGTALGFIAMALLFPLVKREKLGTPGLSVAGAFFFNAGQALAGYAAVGNAMLYYLTPMGLLSVPAGLITGFLAAELNRRLPKAARS